MVINPKDIKASKYNPRVITDEEKKGLGNSIKMFDDISGITYNVRTGQLITGHQRWAELNTKYRKLNLQKIDVNDKKSEQWLAIYNEDEYTGFSIRVVNWPEDKEKAANIAANSHTIQGKFELEALSTLLMELDLDIRNELVLGKLELDLGLNLDLDSKDIDDAEFPDLNSGAQDGFSQMKFILTQDQLATVEKAINMAKEETHDFRDGNPNAFALAFICKAYLE